MRYLLNLLFLLLVSLCSVEPDFQRCPKYLEDDGQELLKERVFAGTASGMVAKTLVNAQDGVVISSNLLRWTELIMGSHQSVDDLREITPSDVLVPTHFVASERRGQINGRLFAYLREGGNP